MDYLRGGLCIYAHERERVVTTPTTGMWPLEGSVVNVALGPKQVNYPWCTQSYNNLIRSNQMSKHTMQLSQVRLAPVHNLCGILIYLTASLTVIRCPNSLCNYLELGLLPFINSVLLGLRLPSKLKAKAKVGDFSAHAEPALPLGRVRQVFWAADCL